MNFSKKINYSVIRILDEDEHNYYLLSLKSQENNLNIALFVYLRRIFETIIEEQKTKVLLGERKRIFKNAVSEYETL